MENAAVPGPADRGDRWLTVSRVNVRCSHTMRIRRTLNQFSRVVRQPVIDTPSVMDPFAEIDSTRRSVVDGLCASAPCPAEQLHPFDRGARILRKTVQAAAYQRGFLSAPGVGRRAVEFRTPHVPSPLRHMPRPTPAPDPKFSANPFECWRHNDEGTP